MIDTSNMTSTCSTRFVRGIGFAALLVATVTSGCATGHTVETLASGTIVHTFRREFANAHLVVRGRQSFLVDSGLEVQGPMLEQDIRREGLDPSQLSAIIVTHAHADHAGGASYFHRTFGTRVVAGQSDRGMLASGHNERLCPTSGTARGRLETDQNAVYTPFEAQVLVPDNTEIDLRTVTGIPGRIVSLPGHTNGSLVVLVDGAAFVGDLFRGAIVGSTAEIHFYMCDLEDNRRDVRRLLNELTPYASTFYPGHFGPLTREAVQDQFF